MEERTTMMGWYGWNHMGGWGWFAMIASSLLLAALVVVGIVVLARLGKRPPDVPPAPPRSPEELLAERLARGEIGEDEYRSRLAALSGTGHRPGAP
ncbi:SHOCT domain-containing protein [Geodermatophilus sp. SYSU D00697]